jgi:thymidylate synthase (FAD)
MTIKLLHHTPLWIAANAIRMSRDNHKQSDSFMIKKNDQCPYCGFDNIDMFDNILYCPSCRSELISHTGEKDKELIDRIGNKHKHKGVLEMLTYTFEIDGISRSCLQEHVRHRTAKLVVQSTRYVLHKKLKNERPFDPTNSYDIQRASKYLVLTDNEEVNRSTIQSLNNLITILNQNTPNDIAKLALPENFKTKLQWQIDGRNLQNYLQLRTANDAHWEIRKLAFAIYDALPNEHKYLFSNSIK